MAVDLTFQVLVQYESTEYLGGTQTRDVIAVGYLTNGHGVYFEVRIPKASYSAAQVRAFGIGYTGTVEDIFNVPGVADIEWTQTVTAGNNLQDTLILTVMSPSGNSSATLAVPWATLNRQFVEPDVDALRVKLADAEAVTG